MLDLFCGRLGWSKAFLARGWECVGVDLVEPPDFGADEALQFKKACSFSFVNEDILNLKYNHSIQRYGINGRGSFDPFDFICASPPCEQFSTIRNFRQPVPYPELGIKLFNHTRTICEQAGLPYVIENVAGAMRFVGKADKHCGPYYLWGSGVPPILPQGINKGLTQKSMGFRELKGTEGWNARNGERGKKSAALASTIPPELAHTVAEYAERLLEVKA